MAKMPEPNRIQGHGGPTLVTSDPDDTRVRRAQLKSMELTQRLWPGEAVEAGREVLAILGIAECLDCRDGTCDRRR